LGRLIFFLLLGLAAWWLVRGFSRAKIKQGEAPGVENMVACAQCGVNLPRSSAREDKGRFFCLDNPHCHP
jgi:uncharacterized protein